MLTKRSPTILTLLLTALLSACLPQFAPAQQAQATQRVGTPALVTATPNMAGFRVLAEPAACTLATLKSIRVSVNHGSLLAWSPGEDRLAWIEPTDSHLWYAGSLVVAAGPDYLNPVTIAQNVTGGLVWSPDGSQIAFTALRISENLYTILVANADGSNLRDLFSGSAARMDSFSSPKAIVAWDTTDRMQVLAECGPGCQKVYAIDPGSGSRSEIAPAQTPNPTQVWLPERKEVNIDPEMYPVMVEPNWSPDGSVAVYFTAKGYLEVLLAEPRQAFGIPMENYLPVFLTQPGNRETHWSPGSDRLAVRIDDRVVILQIPCTP